MEFGLFFQALLSELWLWEPNVLHKHDYLWILFNKTYVSVCVCVCVWLCACVHRSIGPRFCTYVTCSSVIQLVVCRFMFFSVHFAVSSCWGLQLFGWNGKRTSIDIYFLVNNVGVVIPFTRRCLGHALFTVGLINSLDTQTMRPIVHP